MKRSYSAILPLVSLAGVAALTAGCGGGSSSASKPHLTNAAKSLNAGITAAKAGNAKAAKADFDAVLKVQPHNVQAHYNLGVLAQQSNDTATALTEYGDALATNQTYVPALYNEAVIEQGSHPSVAMVTYRKIVSLQHNSPTAYLNLGLLEVKAHNRKQGLPDLLQALKEDPSLASGLPPKLKAAVGRADASAPQPSSTPGSS